MSIKLTIYHNPRCGKSRAALKELEAKGEDLHVVEYLKDTLSVDALKLICSQLAIRPEALIRKGEELYKSTYKNQSLTDAEWFKVLSVNPILIERPIVVKGDRAVIARAEGVLAKFLK